MNKILPILILIWTVSISCSEEDELISTPGDSESTSYTFLALGDSYTIGQGVPQKDRWPIQLQARAAEFDKSISEVDIIAQTGWTTTDLLLGIENNAPENYDIVSLLIGVNNQNQNVSFPVFEEEFDSLLHIAGNLAGGLERVFVVSIPDYGVTPFGSNNSEQIAKEIDNYNNYIEDRCIQMAVPFIYITDISRELGNGEDALAPDQLHPSGTQYGMWVEEMLPIVLNLLQE